MLTGIDVSSYQPGTFDTTGLSFAFTKVTEGLSYVNPEWTTQRATMTAAGLVRGFYHYPHIANDPIAEADHFLSQLSLAPGDILCLDWEWYGQSVTNQQALDYRAKWIPYVQSKAPGHRVVLYADRNN
jgi:GH25 family lysozyme M1 (1,4-beta-N-acetylmuramidase)